MLKVIPSAMVSLDRVLQAPGGQVARVLGAYARKAG